LLKFKHLDRTDKTIVSISSICALLLSWWLYYDVAHHNSNLDGLTKIGEIVSTRNKVKRKFNRSLIWYDTTANETLYEDDWIYTGSDSVVQIRLSTGDEIAIEPDSLVVLSQRNGFVELNLQHGQMLANLKSSKVNINVINNKQKQVISVPSGLSRIRNIGEDLSKAMSAPVAEPLPQFSSLEETIARQVIEPPPGYLPLDKNSDLFFPEETLSEAHLYPGQSATLKLHWIDPLSKWSNYNIEVAQQNDFSQPLLTKSLSRPELDLQLKKSGEYYYRVQALNTDEKSQWSSAQTAQMIIHWKERGQGVQLAKDNIRYELKESELKSLTPGGQWKNPGAETLALNWEPVEGAQSYRVIVSDKEDFSNIIEEKSTQSDQIQLDHLALGTNHVKVVAEDANGVALTEETKAQVITQLPPPRREHLSTQRNSEGQLVLNWEKAPAGQAFEVTYTTDKSGQAPKIKKFVQGRQLKLNEDSNYIQWQVRAVDPKTRGQLSRLSESKDWYEQAKQLASVAGDGPSTSPIRPIILSPAARKTYVTTSKQPLFIVVQWDYEKEAKAYAVEISPTPDMSRTVFKQKVKDKKQIFVRESFKPGIYYLRVRALNEDVTQESWSEVEAFRVLER
jgi:hypothetical protein